MSTLAEFPQGIPIPTEEIRAALDSVAYPGFTGTVQLEIGLRAEAAQCVMIGVVRRQSHRAETVTRQELPDPSRKKPVDKVIDQIKSRLFIRTVVTAVEAHYLNGVLQNWTHSE
jgi:hypothetical protein